MDRLLTLLIASCMILLSGCAPQQADNTSQIQQDKLDNGLQTIVIENRNSHSNNEIDIRLLIHAGSLQETDDERGYAHFVEHMAFNGTRDYPKNKLTEALTNLGIRFGSHANATTSFDYTEYRIKLDTADKQRLSKAIEILAQWAMHIQFDVKEVKQEIPVILEEWRLREPTLKSASHQFRQALFKDSLLVKRMPIGTQRHIKKATRKTLKAFYQRWYRPDNTALIVSGDINSNEVKQLIKEHFSDWKPAENPIQPEVANLNLDAIPQTMIFSDPNTLASQVGLGFLSTSDWPKTLKERGQNIAWQIGLQVLNQRLSNRVIQTAGKVANAGTQWQRYSPQTLSIQLFTSLAKDDYTQGMALLSSELAHLKQAGVTQQELDNARKGLLANHQAQQDSANYLANMAVYHYLYGWPLITHEDWSQTLDKHLSTMNTQRIHGAINKLFSAKPRLVVMYNDQLPKPEVAALQTLLDHPPAIIADAAPVNSDDMWAINPATTGNIIKESQTALGATEWRLDNGITVLYKHNDTQPNHVSFYLAAEGGLNLLNKAETIQARLALNIAASSGLRHLDGPKLKQWLQSQGMTLLPSIDFYKRGFYGDAPSDKFAELMQLLHISLTEARISPDVSLHILNQSKTLIAQMHKHPAWKGQQEIEKQILLSDPALRTLTIDEISAIKPMQLQSIYRKFIAGAQDYQLAIVGDISQDEAKTIVLNSIANLTNSPFQGKARNYPVPTKNVDFEYSGNGLRTANVSLRWVMPKQQLKNYKFDDLQILASWIQDPLNNAIREKQGLVYSIQTSQEGSAKHSSAWVFNIDFACDVDKRDEVIKHVKQTLTTLAKQDIKASKIEALIKARLDEKRQEYSQPEQQARWLAANAIYNENKQVHVLDLDNRYQNITPKKLNRLFEEILNTKNITVEVSSIP